MADKGEYRGIYVALPHDPDFQDLIPEARACWYPLKLELGLSGIDVCYPETVARLTGYPSERVAEGLANLIQNGWLRIERNVMWLVDAVAWDPCKPLNIPNSRKSIQAHLSTLPKLAIVNDFARRHGLAEPYPEAQPIPNPSATQAEHGERRTENGEGKTENGEPDVADIPAEPSRAREEQATTSNDRALAIELEEQVRAFAVAAFGLGSPHIEPFVKASRRATDPALDLECWKNGTGRSVPYEDRSRILALALLRWDEQGRTMPLRSCVKYEALQQTDPHPSPVAKPHPDSQAARVSSEKPRERAPRGEGPAKLTVSDGGVDPDVVAKRRIREWEDAASKAECDVLRTRAKREVEEDESTASLRIALGEAAVRGRVQARYEALVLEQLGEAAA